MRKKVAKLLRVTIVVLLALSVLGLPNLSQAKSKQGRTRTVGHAQTYHYNNKKSSKHYSSNNSGSRSGRKSSSRRPSARVTHMSRGFWEHDDCGHFTGRYSKCKPYF